MNVSPVISSAIGPTSAASFPLVYPSATRATTDTVASSVVELSAPGKLLAAASAISNPPAAQGSFASAASEAQTFTDTFNGLMQYIYDVLQNIAFQPPSAPSLATLLLQTLNTQQPAVNGQSFVASLASIGIASQTPAVLNPSGSMTVDFNTLQSAFNADQGETLSLISQAHQSLGQLASALVGAPNTLAQTGGAVAAPAPAPTSLAAPAAVIAVAAAAQSMPANVAPAALPGNPTGLDPLIVAKSPITAQAIAAYHLTDGLFDTRTPPMKVVLPVPNAEYSPIVPIPAVTRDLHHGDNNRRFRAR